MTKNYVIKCSGAREKATQEKDPQVTVESWFLSLEAFSVYSKKCPPNAQRIGCQD